MGVIISKAQELTGTVEKSCVICPICPAPNITALYTDFAIILM